MWLQTKYGFYSVVEHNDDVHTVLIRARAREDLENLCDLADAVRRDYSKGEVVGIDHSAIQFTPNADYAYRIICPRQSWMEVSLRLMTEIDYGNFKNAVSARDPERSNLYHRVWGVLYSIQGSIGWFADEGEDYVFSAEDDTEEAIVKKYLDECGDPR